MHSGLRGDSFCEDRGTYAEYGTLIPDPSPRGRRESFGIRDFG